MGNTEQIISGNHESYKYIFVLCNIGLSLSLYWRIDEIKNLQDKKDIALDSQNFKYLPNSACSFGGGGGGGVLKAGSRDVICNIQFLSNPMIMTCESSL